MNAKESLAADRDAEEAWRLLLLSREQDGDEPDAMAIEALYAIAAELRAQRVYANYLEGRNDAIRLRKSSPGAKREVDG